MMVGTVNINQFTMMGNLTIDSTTIFMLSYVLFINPQKQNGGHKMTYEKLNHSSKRGH